MPLIQSFNINKEGVHHLSTVTDSSTFYENVNSELSLAIPVTGGLNNGAYEDISISQSYEFKHQCPNNPIYLRWVNRFGGLDYWLFEGKHSKSIGVKTGKTYKVYQDDLESADNPEREVCESLYQVFRNGRQ